MDSRSTLVACAFGALAFAGSSLVSTSSALAQCGAAQKQALDAKGTSECSAEVSAVAMIESPQAAGAKADIVDTAVAAGSFKTLAAALQAAGLVETLKGAGPFTVFAPTDEAFAKLPAGTVESLLKPENKDLLVAVLTYHVVPGKAMAKDVLGRPSWTTVNGQRVDISQKNGKAMIDGATITATDVSASNGVIHVIDTVIMPARANLVETAREAKFTTLVRLVEAAGLASVLSGKEPLTVFAPTDEAFAKLPQATLDSLLKPENKAELVKILTFHVVPGRVYSDQAIAAKSAATVQGGRVTIAERGGKVMVDNATVAKADIEASNGVIHVIDTVILPK